MSENKNPLRAENFSTGAGWDGKTVTILSVRAENRALTYKDGTPVIDKDTGSQSVIPMLRVTGIADPDGGKEPKERTEEIQTGFQATADGEGFVDREGKAARFRAGSNMGNFFAALATAGFDVDQLWDAANERTIYSKLNGARFVFRSEQVNDKDGKPKKDKGGYNVIRNLPAKFIGYRSGNGAAAATPGNASREQAQSVVLKILQDAGKPLSRLEVVRALGPQNASVAALVVSDAFHAAAPWKSDGQTLSL